MQDTLGRTALMFAAGNNAKEAMLALMDAGGQQALSLQDNRGNNVLKYALEDSEVKQLLEKRCASSRPSQRGSRCKRQLFPSIRKSTLHIFLHQQGTDSPQISDITTCSERLEQLEYRTPGKCHIC